LFGIGTASSMQYFGTNQAGYRGYNNPNLANVLPTPADTATGPTTGTTYSYVMQIVAPARSIANETINVWIDPTEASIQLGNLGTPTLTWTANVLTSTNLQPTRVQLVAQNADVSFDEIRIGTSLAEVTPIPEPAAMVSLLALGAGAILRRRRGRDLPRV